VFRFVQIWPIQPHASVFTLRWPPVFSLLGVSQPPLPTPDFLKVTVGGATWNDPLLSHHKQLAPFLFPWFPCSFSFPTVAFLSGVQRSHSHEETGSRGGGGGGPPVGHPPLTIPGPQTLQSAFTSTQCFSLPPPLQPLCTPPLPGARLFNS